MNDEGRNLGICMTILQGVEEQIRFADQKAAFVLGINTLMFGFAAASIGTLKHALDVASTATLARVGLAALCLYGVCFVIAVGLLMYGVMSRLGALSAKSCVFFGHIATYYGKHHAQYLAEVCAMTDGEWFREVGTQIVEISQIALLKHRAVSRAAVSTIVGLAGWVVGIFCVMFLSA